MTYLESRTAAAAASHAPRTVSPGGDPSSRWAAAAAAIGRSLEQTAYWDDAREECNWLGHRDIEDALTAPYSVRNAALSPELYSGSSGVAWFLAELGAALGDASLLETARAALRRSVRYLRKHSTPAYPLSLYAGQLGLLWVSVRLAELTADPSLEEDSAWLFEEALRGRGQPHPYDVIGGNAGAIVGLLHIAGSFRPGPCRELALDLGDELCRAATWADGACSWQASEGFTKLPPMTGFSHGASGIAVALLHLFELTQERRFLDVARGAFAFEDALYNPRERNWIDTRYPYRHEDGAVVGRFRRRWCHGAPGIALARALAVRLDPNGAERHEELARAAVATTIAALEECAREPDHDTTLCHGIAGLAEISLVVDGLLGRAESAATAEAILAERIARYGGWRDWPSGLGTRGPTPCLMVGASGIGMHLLRRAVGDTLPSPLLMMAPARREGVRPGP